MTPKTYSREEVYAICQLAIRAVANIDPWVRNEHGAITGLAVPPWSEAEGRAADFAISSFDNGERP